MKNLFLRFFLFSLLCILISCKENKTLSLVMSEPNPANSISARTDEVFIQKIEELSKGSISIMLYPDGSLGDNPTVMELVMQPKASIHIARISPATLVKYDCKLHELLDIPFTFQNHEHFWRFNESQVAERILQEPYNLNIGVRGLYFSEEGFRHFFSTKKLNSIEDFAGESIRTAGNSMMKRIVTAFKGIPVEVSFTDLYSALQTNLVTIAEQPISNYLANNFNKVAPYMILDGHELGIAEVVINSNLWDSLSEEQKNIFIEAGKYAATYCSKVVLESENQAKLALRSDGTEFTEIDDISKWQEQCADVISESSRENIEVYGEIIRFAD